jgi:Pyridoxamine 5'-phosphate oxidase
MGRTYDEIDDRLSEFLRAQHVFFVGTAPADGGHVNVSPKGLDTFAILGPRAVAYLDLTGSGIETIAHVRQNGRITLLFCAFDGAPRIVRLYGRGRVLDVGSAEFATLAPRFGAYASARAVIEVALDRIADSCGYGVPQYRYEGERSQLLDWAARKGPDGVLEYRNERNVRSIDGLPGLAPRRR